MFDINGGGLFSKLIDHLKSPVIRINVRKVDVEYDVEVDNKDYLIMNHGSFYMICAVVGTLLRFWIES